MEEMDIEPPGACADEPGGETVVMLTLEQLRRFGPLSVRQYLTYACPKLVSLGGEARVTAFDRHQAAAMGAGGGS